MSAVSFDRPSFRATPRDPSLDLRLAGIPRRFLGATLESYACQSTGQQRVKRFAQDYATRFGSKDTLGQGAVFIGNVGTGKTHLACAIAAHVLGQQPDGKPKRKVRYTTVYDAIRRVKETWSREASETESQAVAALAEPDLLILDEVGVQFGSEVERNIMFDVLNKRYEAQRATIFISNLSADEVWGFLGTRIKDRLREDGATLHVFDWESHRGQ